MPYNISSTTLVGLGLPTLFAADPLPPKTPANHIPPHWGDNDNLLLDGVAMPPDLNQLIDWRSAIVLEEIKDANGTIVKYKVQYSIYKVDECGNRIAGTRQIKTVVAEITPAQYDRAVKGGGFSRPMLPSPNPSPPVTVDPKVPALTPDEITRSEFYNKFPRLKELVDGSYFGDNVLLPGDTVPADGWLPVKLGNGQTVLVHNVYDWKSAVILERIGDKVCCEVRRVYVGKDGRAILGIGQLRFFTEKICLSIEDYNSIAARGGFVSRPTDVAPPTGFFPTSRRSAILYGDPIPTSGVALDWPNAQAVSAHEYATFTGNPFNPVAFQDKICVKVPRVAIDTNGLRLDNPPIDYVIECLTKVDYDDKLSRGAFSGGGTNANILDRLRNPNVGPRPKPEGRTSLRDNRAIDDLLPPECKPPEAPRVPGAGIVEPTPGVKPPPPTTAGPAAPTNPEMPAPPSSRVIPAPPSAPELPPNATDDIPGYLRPKKPPTLTGNNVPLPPGAIVLPPGFIPPYPGPASGYTGPRCLYPMYRDLGRSFGRACVTGAVDAGTALARGLVGTLLECLPLVALETALRSVVDVASSVIFLRDFISFLQELGFPNCHLENLGPNPGIGPSDVVILDENPFCVEKIVDGLTGGNKVTQEDIINVLVARMVQLGKIDILQCRKYRHQRLPSPTRGRLANPDGTIGTIGIESRMSQMCEMLTKLAQCKTQKNDLAAGIVKPASEYTCRPLLDWVNSNPIIRNTWNELQKERDLLEKMRIGFCSGVLMDDRFRDVPTGDLEKCVEVMKKIGEINFKLNAIRDFINENDRTCTVPPFSALVAVLNATQTAAFVTVPTGPGGLRRVGVGSRGVGGPAITAPTFPPGSIVGGSGYELPIIRGGSDLPPVDCPACQPGRIGGFSEAAVAVTPQVPNPRHAFDVGAIITLPARRQGGRKNNPESSFLMWSNPRDILRGIFDNDGGGEGESSSEM